MSQTVLLFLHQTDPLEPAGHVDFRQVPVEKDADYTCNPPGLLPFRVIQEISWYLRLPLRLRQGIVGRFKWIEKNS